MRTMHDSDDPYADAMSEDGGSESSDNQTAILPKSFCGSMQYKVGDTFSVKVDQITDDSYVVSKDSGEDKEDREEELAPEDQAGAEAGGEADSEMGSYMT